MLDSGLLITGLGTCALGVVVLVVTLLGSPDRGGVAQSLAQVERMAVLAAGGTRQDLDLGERVIGPAMQKMLGLARRLSPDGVAGRIQRHLDLAGNPPAWSIERIFAFKGVGLLVGAGLGFLLGLSVFNPVLCIPVAAAAGFFLPDLLTYNAGTKRQQQIRKTLPDALDMLTVSVEAGLGFDAALSQVVKNTEGPLPGEFFRVLQEMQIGKSRAAAFRGMTERTTVSDLRAFVSAVVQADKLGIPIGKVLREQAREMRTKRRQRAEEKAQQLPVKILFPMLMFVFPALFVVVIGPGAIAIIRTFTGGSL